MTASYSSQATGLGKISYLDLVVRTLNEESLFRNWSAMDDNWTGTEKDFRVHVTRSGAIKFSEDGGAFPASSAQGHVVGKAYRKFLLAKIAVTDGLMAAIRGAGAVTDATEEEVKQMMKDILKYESFFAYGDGTGVISTFEDNTLASSASNVPVDDGRFLRGFSRSSMEFDVYNAALTTKRGTVKVTSVANAPTATGAYSVTFDQTVAGTIATDVLIPKDCLNRAITGLDALVDDAASTFQNIAVNTYPEYSSMVSSNGGTNRELSPNLFRRVLAGLVEKSGQMPGNLKALASPRQLIKMEELYEGELRLQPGTSVGGIKVSKFQSALGNIDLAHDTEAPLNTMFLPDLSKIRREVPKVRQRRRNDSGGVCNAAIVCARSEAHDS